MIIRKVRYKLNSYFYHKIERYAYQSTWFNVELFQDCKKFWNYNEYDIEIVNLGSTSGVNDFCYDGLPIKAANWAISRNPLKGDLAILKNYCSHLNPKSSLVILPLCPFSLLAGNYDITEDRYYSILKPSFIPYYTLNKQRKINELRDNPITKYPVMELIADIKRKLKKDFQQIVSEEFMIQDAQKWLSSWMCEFNIDSFCAPFSSKNKMSIHNALNLIRELCDYCNSRKFSMIIVIPPMYYTLSELFTPDIQKVLLSPLDEIVLDYNIYFKSYIYDNRISNNINYFQNSFIMNKKGANYFTKILLNELNVI